jgi:hypothetical protein
MRGATTPLPHTWYLIKRKDYFALPPSLFISYCLYFQTACLTNEPSILAEAVKRVNFIREEPGSSLGRGIENHHICRNFLCTSRRMLHFNRAPRHEGL